MSFGPSIKALKSKILPLKKCRYNVRLNFFLLTIDIQLLYSVSFKYFIGE